MIRCLTSAILGGVFATLVLDVGSTLIRTADLTAGAPPKIIGKWFMYVLRGCFIHADIVSSPDIHIRMPLVFAIHYGIGIGLACVFVALSTWPPLQRGIFSYAFGFGVLTTVLAWFVMFPAMGWGSREHGARNSFCSLALAWSTTRSTGWGSLFGQPRWRRC